MRAFTLRVEEARKRCAEAQSLGAAAASNMRARTSAQALLLATATLACFFFWCEACEPAQKQYGCKPYGAQCVCGYECAGVADYTYRTKGECLKAQRERSSNICYRKPCMRGICLQTMQEPGFTCKCEGTGYYGSHCEKACPTIPMRGLVFPHECVVI